MYIKLQQTPDTLVNEVDQILAVPTTSYGHIENNIIDLLPKPGTCYSWGGSHYKTFDGEVYRYYY